MFARSIAALMTIAALAPVAGAVAKAPVHTTAASHAKVVKKSTTAARKSMSKAGATTVVVHGSGTSVAYFDAGPAGGKNNPTQATCDLWADRLNADQDAQDNATDHQGIIDATNQLNTDYNNTLDAGCFVVD
jgi:hypothetical protein